MSLGHNEYIFSYSNSLLNQIIGLCEGLRRSKLYLCLSQHLHRSCLLLASTLHNQIYVWSLPSDFSTHLQRKKQKTKVVLRFLVFCRHGHSFKCTKLLPVKPPATQQANLLGRRLVSDRVKTTRFIRFSVLIDCYWNLGNLLPLLWILYLLAFRPC